MELPIEFLEVLSFYRQPHTLEEGWRRLESAAKGPRGLLNAFTQVSQLCEAGILVRAEGEAGTRPDPPTHAFGPTAQIRMLEDRVRTARYLQAIRRTVRAGDVVVDIGTGTGVLAVAAAKAGARRVYAIEARPIAEAAQRFFDGSGCGDRITLLRGFSADLSLPEQADVLVSEIIGNEPLAEGLLETTQDALARFLKPGARMIPARIRIGATPVEVPEAVRQRAFFTPDLLVRWERWYGLPFPALQDGGEAAAGPCRRIFLNPWQARRWPALAAPAELHDLDLANLPHQDPAADVDVTIAQAGRLDAFLVHFEATLSEDVVITTQASRSTRRNHWRSPLWLLPQPRPVQAGDELRVRAGFHHGRASFALL
jgi:precorrin-6B methylase 2